MGKFYDISMLITNELPTLKISDDIVLTVNNRHNAILNVQAMLQENERRPAEEQMNEPELIAASLKLLIGEKNASAIEELNLPMPEYKLIFNVVMGIAVGSYEGEATP